MNECIPEAILPDRRNKPWLTKEIVRIIMKKRNYYYNKRSGRYEDHL